MVPNIASDYYIPDIELFFRFLAVLAFIAYHTLFDSLPTQGSIGKVICKLVVVDASGERLSAGRALGRNAGKILSGLICCLGFFCVLWDSHRQGLHDNLAKTYVIKKKG
ncbi:RDD family protein [Mucilaginibacter hurinus]|uniref:RDD family protein n=1 Tax=Mucilaginibacter hurinus TaxID=2201324 RepID=UPI001314377F|nr:RDD family protein [Mucilaginibacter hurinus]